MAPQNETFAQLNINNATCQNYGEKFRFRIFSLLLTNSVCVRVNVYVSFTVKIFGSLFGLVASIP